jgi:hypothetical protein
MYYSETSQKLRKALRDNKFLFIFLFIYCAILAILDQDKTIPKKDNPSETESNPLIKPSHFASAELGPLQKTEDGT